MEEEKLQTSVFGRIIVLTPDPASFTKETMHKPFMLLAETKHELSWLGVNPLPNILDVMGMPSGGGPPGFSAVEHLRNPPHEAYRLIAGFLPGAQVVLHSESIVCVTRIGTCISVGLVINYLEFRYAYQTDGVQERPTTRKEIVEAVEKAGFAVIPLIEYVIPEVLLGGMPIVGHGG